MPEELTLTEDVEHLTAIDELDGTSPHHAHRCFERLLRLAEDRRSPGEELHLHRSRELLQRVLPEIVERARTDPGTRLRRACLVATERAQIHEFPRREPTRMRRRELGMKARRERSPFPDAQSPLPNRAFEQSGSLPLADPGATAQEHSGSAEAQAGSEQRHHRHAGRREPARGLRRRSSGRLRGRSGGARSHLRTARTGCSGRMGPRYLGLPHSLRPANRSFARSLSPSSGGESSRCS